MEKDKFSAKRKKLKGEKMTKELIICIVIVVLIFIGNAFTQRYLDNSVTETSENLNELKKELVKDKEEINLDLAQNSIESIYETWEKKQGKLSFYIEHNELEKVNTQLTGLIGCIEMEEFAQAVPELDKAVFILEHIKNKSMVSLKNIF